MLCQNCNKNEATIHVQQVINGKVTSIHLCAVCAAKKAAADPDFQSFNLAEMIFDFAGKIAGQNTGKKEEAPQNAPRCSVCGWDLESYRKTGYLGCPECYKSFENILHEILKTMHHADVHKGKIPLNSPDERPERTRTLLRREIEDLREKLNLAVQKEEYEEAAQIRDRIFALEEQLLDLNGGKHDA